MRRASSRNRERAIGESSVSGFGTLRARSRPRSWSLTCRTVPEPPRPISRSTSNLPIRFVNAFPPPTPLPRLSESGGTFEASTTWRIRAMSAGSVSVSDGAAAAGSFSGCRLVLGPVSTRSGIESLPEN